MLFEYFDMLSGAPIHIHGIGHVRSPKLKEITPAGGMGQRTYSLYLSFLSWDKENLLKYVQLMRFRANDRLRQDVFNVFDVVTLLKQTRELCREVLSFFMLEGAEWDEKNRRFIMVAIDGDVKNQVGEINRDNFEDVRKAILQMNFIGLDQDEEPVKFANNTAKELWERVQKHKKEFSSSTPKDKPEYHLGNIVSKLCAAHQSYNLLNVYDLTVFQLYDSFFQLGHLRSSDLNEQIFSNHGGDKFKFENWLKPILRNV